MIKIELKDFTLSFGGENYSLAVPTSLFSALTDAGVIKNPYYGDEERDRFAVLCDECVISASFVLSADAAKLKYSYLTVPDLDTEAELVFNKKSTFKINGARQHDLDISGLTVAGENTVEIRIPKSSAPRDVTLFYRMEFLAFAHARISSISAKPRFVSESVSVEVAMELLGSSDDVKAVATLISPSGQIYYGGVTNGTTMINVPDPLLWWPLGYGVQNLYKLSVNLYYENEFIDSKEIKIGLRSVFRDGRRGAGFTVNGTEIFSMGAEYIMDGMTPAFSTSSRAGTLIPAAARAHMNFIRFFGKGRYPCEAFLELCDSYGLVVEFVVDTEKLTPEREKTYMRELTSNLRRMARHPSLISIAYDPNTTSEKAASLIGEAKAAAFSTVFIRQLDGDDRCEASVSIPPTKTLLSALESEDLNVFSYVMEQHIDSTQSIAKMLSLAAMRYKYANGMSQLGYMSGLLQAKLNEEFVRDARIERGQRGAAVLSSLSDSSPSVSSALVDSDGRFKVSYYSAKQSFAPQRLYVLDAGDACIRFAVSNETKKPFNGIIAYAIKDACNNPIHTGTLDALSNAYSSYVCDPIDFSEYLNGHERECYLEYSLICDSLKVSSGAHLFVPPKHFKFANPMVLSEISGSGREFTLVCKASALAKDVMFGFESVDAVFEDNCIDITDTSVRRIAFVTASTMSVEKLMSELLVKSVFDIGNKN